MIALLHLVGNIGVRAALENRYLLAVTGFDIGSGQVACIAIFLSGPYIPYLTSLQRITQNSVTYCMKILKSLVLRIHFEHLISPIVVLSHKISNTFCFHSWYVFHNRVILRCNHCKMAALRRTGASVIRWSIGLNNIFIQQRSCRQHIGGIKCGFFVVGCEK